MAVPHHEGHGTNICGLWLSQVGVVACQCRDVAPAQHGRPAVSSWDLQDPLADANGAETSPETWDVTFSFSTHFFFPLKHLNLIVLTLSASRMQSLWKALTGKELSCIWTAAPQRGPGQVLPSPTLLLWGCVTLWWALSKLCLVLHLT